MSIWPIVHSGKCPFWKIGFRGNVHSANCTSWQVSILENRFSGKCPFGQMYILESVRSGKCTLGIMSIRLSVFRKNVLSGRCFSERCTGFVLHTSKCNISFSQSLVSCLSVKQRDFRLGAINHGINSSGQ